MALVMLFLRRAQNNSRPHPFQLQLVAPQHLTVRPLIMSPNGMQPLVSTAFNHPTQLLASRGVVGAVDPGRITTATTITSGVRWIVFA